MAVPVQALAQPAARAGLRRGHTGYWYTLVYLSLLLYSPPLFRDWDIVARGVHPDQLLLLGSFFLLAFARPDRTVAALFTPVGRALGAFLLASVISALVGAAFIPNASLERGLVITWGQSRGLLAFIVVSVALWDTPAERRRSILRALFALAAGVALIAVLQGVGVEAVRQFSLANYSRKDSRDIELALEAGRAFGTFDGQPNILGSFSVLALALVLAELSDVHSRLRALLVALFVLFAACLAFSWSRGAIAGALVCVVVVLLHTRRRAVFRVGVVAIALGLGLYSIAPESVQVRFQQLASARDGAGESIFATRQQFWETNLRAFRDYPWFGPRGVPLDPPDSLYIALLVSGGVIGALLFGGAIYRAIREVRKRTDPVGRFLAAPITAISVAWLVNGISSSPFFGERIQELYWVLIAIALAPCPVP